jgi:ABC-type multidrug transport system ATPase subunit
MKLHLEVSHLYKHYDGKIVLKDCTFLFKDTGAYAVMGPNGSGKSTLFRLCALLEDPDKGEITYWSGDTIISRDIQLQRRVTLVLPKIGVFNTTVFKNVAYGLRIRGVGRKDILKRVKESLDVAGLAHKEEQNALTLSSGELQRLGIARALVIKPEMIFLDEPTAFVDEENKKIIEDLILKIKNDGKSTIIITTHDRAQAERLGDKILLMQNGRLLGGKL